MIHLYLSLLFLLIFLILLFFFYFYFSSLIFFNNHKKNKVIDLNNPYTHIIITCNQFIFNNPHSSFSFQNLVSHFNSPSSPSSSAYNNNNNSNLIEKLLIEIITLLRNQGCSITIIGLNYEILKDLKIFIDKLSPGKKGELNIFQGDCQNYDNIKNIIHESCQRFNGQVHTLITTPIPSSSSSTSFISNIQEQELSYSHYNNSMNVNYFGVLNSILSVLSIMKTQKLGRILVLSSILSDSVNNNFGLLNHSAYYSSQYAVQGLIDSLYYELFFDNIHPTLVLLNDHNLSNITLTTQSIVNGIIYWKPFITSDWSSYITKLSTGSIFTPLHSIWDLIFEILLLPRGLWRLIKLTQIKYNMYLLFTSKQKHTSHQITTSDIESNSNSNSLLNPLLKS